MKYELGEKSFSDFQKMLNQWTTTGITFGILKIEFVNKSGNKYVQYMLTKG